MQYLTEGKLGTFKTWAQIWHFPTTEWMFLSSANSYFETKSPKWLYLEAEAYGGWWAHKGRTLMSEISALIKETLESSLIPSAMWGHSHKMTVHKLGRSPSPNTESTCALIF